MLADAGYPLHSNSKMVLITFRALNGFAPNEIKDLLTPCEAGRSLWTHVNQTGYIFNILNVFLKLSYRKVFMNRHVPLLTPFYYRLFLCRLPSACIFVAIVVLVWSYLRIAFVQATEAQLTISVRHKLSLLFIKVIMNLTL